MSKRKGIKKRYLITVSSIILAIVSVLLLRSFDCNFDKRKTTTLKEVKAVFEFNKDFFDETINEKTDDEKARMLRDKFASLISYKKLYDSKEDFKNFRYLPNKNIYGFKLLNNSHIGFYYNSDDCGNTDENKNYCAGIILDTNGNTKPNKFGEDQFLFKIYKNGIKEQ